MTAALTHDERIALESAQRDPARRLGPLVVLRELGRGGMGQVLLAWDERRGELVAVKTLLERATKTARARLEREAKLLAGLGHPGIARLHEAVFEGPGAPYLVMELVRGRPLSALLDDGQPMAPRRAAALVAEIARAVAVAHARGVVHRDLKPQNVMIRDDGRAVVLDFGLARSEQGSTLDLTRTGSIVGTLSYLAPEQIGEAKHADARADVYALGGILYTCLTGRVPFEGPAPAVLVQVRVAPPPAPSEHVPGLDPALEALVLRCLEKRPDDRPSGAAEVGHALEAWLAGARPTRRRRRARALGLLGGALAVTLTVLAVVAATRSRDPDPAPVAATPTPAPSPATALPAPAGPTSDDLALAKRLTVRAFGMDRDEDQSAAEALCTRALELAPGAVEAHSQRGYHRFRQGKHADAAADYKAAVRLAPDTPLLRCNLGLNLSLAGDHEAALAAFDEGLARLPRDPTLLLHRATALVAAGRDAEAQADFEQVAASDPRQLEAHSELGKVHFRRGDFTSAAAAFGRVIELDPTSVVAWRNHASSLLRAGRSAEALRDLERALELDPADATTRARLLEVREMLAAVGSSPDARAEAVGLVDASMTLTAEDRQDEGEARCTRAIELAPDLAAAWAQRGYHRFRKHDFTGAAADYHEATRLEPGSALHLQNLSVNLAAANDPAGALAALDQAVTLDPALRLTTRVDCADQLAKLGRLAEAIGAIEELLAAAPEHPRALTRLGYLHFRTKDHAAAVSAYTRAIAVSPDDPMLFVNRSFNLHELLRHEEALRDAERAVELGPRLAEAWRARGTARLLTGDAAGAEPDLVRSLELEPDHAVTSRNLRAARERLGR